MNKRQSGFTLMEIMIAMFLFAIIMSIVVTGFSVVVRANERIRAHHERLSQVQLAVTIMTRDLSQIVPRNVLDKDETVLGAIVSLDEGRNFEFTRGGYANPFSMIRRSAFIRIGFLIENNTIVRRSWPVLDRAPSTEPVFKTLLNGVEDFSIQMLDDEGNVKSDGSYPILPHGIVLTVTFVNGDVITRVIPLLRGHHV